MLILLFLLITFYTLLNTFISAIEPGPISTGRNYTKPTNFPSPTYEYLTCGTKWLNNVTFVSYSINDYFAIVNATEFTIVAKNWGVKSSTPICEDGAMLMMAPYGKGSYGPQEYYFLDGDSFKFKVGPVFPPSNQYDMIFFGDCTADYTITLESIEIIC